MRPDPTPFGDEVVADLRTTLVAQRDFTRRLEKAVGDVEAAFETNAGTRSAIDEAERLLAELEADADLLQPGDLEGFDPEGIFRIYEERRAAVGADLVRLEYRDWDEFVRQCRTHAFQVGLDPLEPYEALLTEEDLERLRTESYEAQYRWDKLDYFFVGISGALAAAVDFCLVKIPKSLNTGEYAGQEGSPLTEWMQRLDSRKGQVPEDAPAFFKRFAAKAQEYEKVAKTPYDRKYAVFDGKLRHISGMGGRTHRFQSFGHDPVLGFVFGVLDILRGTITGYSYDSGSQLHRLVKGQVFSPIGDDPLGARLTAALVTHLRHLASDVATPLGLPSPMTTLLQSMNVGAFGKNERTVAELSRWMYLNGYDFRHFLTMGLAPAVIEVVLRGYLMIRHYAEHGETKFLLAKSPKYRSMLLSAHAVAAAANAGKVYLAAGNPLAINQAQWMALLRYLGPHMKYWLFDKHRLRLEHMDGINEAAWDDLLVRGGGLMERVARQELAPVVLRGSDHSED